MSTCKLSKHGSSTFLDPQLYKLIVGTLQYVTLTMLDITFNINKACQYMSSPLDSHWSTIQRILRHLSQTMSHGLSFSPSTSTHKFSIRAYNNIDTASDPDDRKSTSDSYIFFGPKPMSWSSKKQSLVARSSTKVEYHILAHTTYELLWLESLLVEVCISFYLSTLLCDNMSDVLLSHN